MPVTTVHLKNAHASALSDTVLQAFEQRCKQLLQRIDEQRRDPSDQDDSVIEIECRIGQFDESSRAFRPGVSQSFFEGMRSHFENKVKQGTWFRSDDRSKRVGFTYTDHLDISFQDGIRVTCKLTKDSSTQHVSDVEIKEVISKRKLGDTADFKIEGSKSSRWILRIGVACEESVPPHSDRYKTYVDAAKSAIFDAFNVSARVKVMGGIDLTINPKVSHVFVLFPPHNEMSARGHMQFNDPIYDMASPNGEIEAEPMRMLKWTLVQPTRLPSLQGRANVQLREQRSELQPTLFLTNLPGIIKLPDGSPYAAYACQYIIEVKRDFILCGHGRFANVGADGAEATQGGGATSGPDLPIKLFRRKCRWSFELRNEQRVELTSTQQSSNLVTLFRETPNFEVELEKTLSAKGARQLAPEQLVSRLRAVRHAEAFLADIASRIYGVVLPPIQTESLPSEQWRRVHEGDLDRERRLFALLKDADASAPPPAKIPRRDSETGVKREAPAGQDGHGADQAGAANFYNSLNRSSQASRADSYIYHMRCLNNFVKSVVIKESISRMRNDCGTHTGVNVLDLACGKGADIQKVMRACKEVGGLRVKDYIGVDIARRSLEDAVERLDSARNKPESTRFIEADLGVHHLSASPGDEGDIKSLEQWDRDSGWQRRPPSQTVPLDLRFHLVSMQFALHYMFQTKPRAMHFFRTIARHMHSGAVFIATTVNADEMIRRLLEAGPGKTGFSLRDNFGVEACRVDFDPAFRDRAFPKAGRPAPDADEMIGIRYNFTLRDGDDDSQQAVAAPEWLVPPKLLVKIAAANCLKLVRYERLPNAAVRNMTDNSPGALYRRMNVLNYQGSISQVEWDIASLYVVVELQKEDPPRSSAEAMQFLRERIPLFDGLDNVERSELLSSLMKYKPDS